MGLTSIALGNRETDIQPVPEGSGPHEKHTRKLTQKGVAL